MRLLFRIENQTIIPQNIAIRGYKQHARYGSLALQKSLRRGIAKKTSDKNDMLIARLNFVISKLPWLLKMANKLPTHNPSILVNAYKFI
ncbi:MAG TPA: hypothetical protein VNW49_05070 [Puia sp.]|nr:hypothetical protein [Puia sp.]